MNWTAETRIAYFNENGRTLTISDGVFTKSGNTYDVTANDDCEAKIGDRFYATFAEAFAAATDGQTVLILKPVSGVGALSVTKTLTLSGCANLSGCTALTVSTGKTLTLVGALTVSGNATVSGAVAGETLTVNGTLTGVNVAKLTFGNGATFAYAGAKLAPAELTQAGALTITGLANAEIGTEVVTAIGLDLSKITATVKEGACLEIVGNTLTVAKEILATITTSSEVEGYDYTNGTVSVTANVKSGKTATAVLTVIGFDGTTVKTIAERSVTSGTALTWDIAEAMEGALEQGGAYTYKVEVMVDNKVAAVKSGEFTAAKWGADGAWFKADASSGTSVVEGGAWDGTAPGIVNNRYAVSDSAFNVTSGAGSSKFTRVDTKVSFESLLDGDPDVVEGDTIGGFVATTEGWKALTLVNGVKAWVTLENADAPAPAVNTEYAIRAELDFSDASAQHVRFFVATEGGDFIPLFHNGSQWLATTKVQQTLQKVEFQGEGALESVMATVEDKALAEVGGAEYVTMAEALAAAKDDSNKSVRLLTNVTLAPTVAGTYRIARNGHAFNLELPEGWTSDWNESTGTLTVIDRQTPFVRELAASTICYGQALSASELTGVMTNKNGMVVEGTFAWTDSTVTPAVSDSDTTEYGVRFTPTDTTKYFEVEDIVSTVTVTAAVLTVTATDVEVVWGNAPTYGRTITGFVLDDTEGVVGGTATYTCEYDTDKGENPTMTTTFDISYKDGLTAANYAFASAATPGKLTVKKAVAEYAGTYYETLTEVVAVAGATENAKVTLQADTTESLSIPENVELDFNGFEAKGITTAGEVDVEVPADSGSGTVVLDVIVTDPSQVKVTVSDDSKQAVVTVNEQGKAVVTVETKPKLVTDIVVAGKALPSPSENGDFKAWLDANIDAYRAANTSSDKISNELQAIVKANGISKLNNYLLFSKNVEDVTASDVVQIVKPKADTSATGIKIDIPSVNPKLGMGYKVVYRVMKGETKIGDDFENRDAVEVPLESGTYRVDAVIVPDNN